MHDTRPDCIPNSKPDELAFSFSEQISVAGAVGLAVEASDDALANLPSFY